MKYRKPSQLMLYREIKAVCSQIHTKQINTVCGQNVGFVKVLGGTESNHWPLNDQRSVPNSIIVSTENSIPVEVRRTFCMDLNWNDGEMWGLTDSLHHETLVMWSGAASCAVGHLHNSQLWYFCFYRLLLHYVSWAVLYIRQDVVSTATVWTTIQDNKGLQSVQNQSDTGTKRTVRL
jgi:hypothetical protein